MRCKIFTIIILFLLSELFLPFRLYAQLSKNLINFLPAVYKPYPVNKAKLTENEMIKIFHYAEGYSAPAVIKDLDSLSNVLGSDTLTEKNDNLCISICRQLTMYNLNTNNFEAASKYCDATLHRFGKKKEYKTLRHSFEKIMGAIYAGLGDYEQSIRYFNTCLDNAKAEKDSTGIAEIYSGLSYPYAILGMYESSVSNLDSSIAYFGNLKEGDPYYPELQDVCVSRCGRYINLYEKTGDKSYGKKASAIINTAESKKNHHYLYDIFPVGIAYNDKDDKRVIFLSDSLLAAISLYNPPHKDVMVAYINKYRALLFLNTNKSATGVSILKQSVQQFQSQKKSNGNAYANIILLSGKLYHHYKNHNQWKQAFIYQEINKNYNDSLRILENRASIFEEGQKYDFSKKEEQLKMLESINIIHRKERDLAIGGSCFLLLCIILTALLSHNINHKLRLKKLVAQKEAELKLEKLQIVSQLQIAELEEKNSLVKKEEQKKLGLELHDNLAANLACVTVMLDMKIKNIFDKKMHGQLTEIREIISEVYNTVRGKSHELYSASATNEDANFYYSKRITDLLQETLPDMFSTQITIDNESLSATSLQVKIEILYIIREAVANIIKHADASKVSILIYKDIPGIILCIMDNEKGFNQPVNKNGMGLNSIKNRAKSVGGKAEFLSGKNGTEIQIVIPQ